MEELNKEQKHIKTDTAAIRETKKKKKRSQLVEDNVMMYSGSPEDNWA